MIRWARAFLDRDAKGQIRYLELALEYSPHNFILLANLAYQRYFLQEYDGALDALRSPLEAGWEYPPMYALAGRCYLKTGKYQDARKILEGSLDIKPVYPDVYGVLSVLSIGERDSIAARRFEAQYFKSCLDYHIPGAQAHGDLGEFYLDVQDTTNALRHLYESLRSDSISSTANSYKERIRSLRH